MNVFSFKVLPFKVHQLLVSMVSPLCANAIFPPLCLRGREREGERESEGERERKRERMTEGFQQWLSLLCIKSPLHYSVHEWRLNKHTNQLIWNPPRVTSEWVCINSSNLWSSSKMTRFDHRWKKVHFPTGTRVFSY